MAESVEARPQNADQYWLILWSNTERKVMARVESNIAAILAIKALLASLWLMARGKGSHISIATNYETIAFAASRDERLGGSVQFPIEGFYFVIGENCPELKQYLSSFEV